MPVETELILDELDPEWRDRFQSDEERARRFYETYNPERWAEARRSVSQLTERGEL